MAKASSSLEEVKENTREVFDALRFSSRDANRLRDELKTLMIGLGHEAKAKKLVED